MAALIVFSRAGTYPAGTAPFSADDSGACADVFDRQPAQCGDGDGGAVDAHALGARDRSRFAGRRVLAGAAACPAYGACRGARQYGLSAGGILSAGTRRFCGARSQGGAALRRDATRP